MKYALIIPKGSRPHPSDKAKGQIDVTFLMLGERRSLFMEILWKYMSLQHKVKGLLFKPTHPLITTI